jgi:CheY-like chemotaxis protein
MVEAGRSRRSLVSQVQRPAEPARILIVDAYGHSREGLSASLRGGGWSVDTADGSWEAVKKAKDGRFGLAIIDLDLPPAHGVAVSGWDLARIFRAFQPGAAIILVTAEWRPDLKAEADRLPHARLVEKPISPFELRELVRALEAERAAPQEPSDPPVDPGIRTAVGE